MSKELAKQKPNFSKIEFLSHRHFEESLLYELGFTSSNIASLETLYIKLFELLNGASISNKHTIHDALYHGKILYIRADMLNLSSLRFLKLLFIDIAQQVRKRKANTVVIADEVSFYTTHYLSGMLATMAGFGVKMILLLQDLAQLRDEPIKNAILTNCSLKLFYKISDTATLDYVERLGGMEPVTKYSQRGTDKTITQELEPLLNSTRIRAMWYQQCTIVISEYLHTALFIQSAPIKVEHPFDWKKYQLKEAVKNDFHFKKRVIVEAKIINQEEKQSVENDTVASLDLDDL